MLFQIQVHGEEYNNQTLETICKHRNNPSLKISYNNVIYNYENFRLLGGIRKNLHRLELEIDAGEPDRNFLDEQRPFLKESRLVDSPEAGPSFKNPHTVDEVLDTLHLTAPPNCLANLTISQTAQIESEPFTTSLPTPDNHSLDKMNVFEFLKSASSIIQRYSGAVEDRDSFIENISLVEQHTPPNHVDTFLSFVKGRMSGNASLICKDCSSIQDIIHQIRLHITDSSSDVIESKLMSLTVGATGINGFCKELEVILNSYLFALVGEDIPFARAQTLTIKRAVECCRRNARSDMVKAVLSAATYATFKDVICKFQTELAQIKREQQRSQQRPYVNPQRNQSGSGSNQNREHSANTRTNYPNSSSRGPSQRQSNVRVLNTDEAGNASAPAEVLAQD